MTQISSSNVTSPNMEYCATQREYQLGATGPAKVAVYMAYTLGGSFFVGLTRLIAALGALCVDYKAKALLQKEQKTEEQTKNDISLEKWVFPTLQTRFEATVGNIESIWDKRARVQTLDQGIEMCKRDISSHWQQVARAILELTVVGGWLYTLIEAVQHYRSSSLHWTRESSVDTLDWGRCKGMLDRFTSDFKDRQYVPKNMIPNPSVSDDSVRTGLNSTMITADPDVIRRVENRATTAAIRVLRNFRIDERADQGAI